LANPIENLRPGVLALFGAWLLFMGGNELLGRLWIQVDGTVVSADTTTGNRPVTRYVVRRSDGQNTNYVAGPTDASLPRRLPLGTVLRKERGHLSFALDGQEIGGFPVLTYGALILAGLGLEVFAWRQWKIRSSLKKMGAV
jgi:hypothetical protein